MNNTLKITFTFLLIGITFFEVYAYNLKQISNNNNLSNSSITDFCQNEKGLMLIGTCDGLNIYNSRDVEIFQPKNENNFLSGSIIDKIIYTNNNIFWIQTYHGLNKYDVNKNTMTHYNEFQKMLYFDKDKSNNLYIINESNCIYYNIYGKSNFKKILMSGVIFSDIQDFFIDQNNVFWIVTNKGYTFTFKSAFVNNELTLIPIKNNLVIAKKIINCFFEDDNFIYIDSDFDLFVYNVITKKKKYITNLKGEILSRGKISSVIKYHDDYLVGFLTNGVLYLEKQNESFNKKEIEIKSGIFCLKKDKLQDIIWIGTDGQGVYILSNTAYSIKSNILTNITDKIQKPVRALYLDKENTFWIGSKGDGILKIYDYNANKNIQDCRIESVNTNNSNLSDNIIYKFQKSKRNILWIGSEEGLNYYSYRSKKIKHIDINLKFLDYKYIHDIYETADSKLWLASVGYGIVCADIKGTDDNISLSNFKHYTINNGSFESNYFFSMYAENDSTLWFANRGFGPFHFNNSTGNLDPVFFYNQHSNQVINDVFVIRKDKDGNMLFGTCFGLVKYTDSNKSKIFNSNNGFLNNSIHAIENDSHSFFWLSTNKGLVQFNSKREAFRIYDSTDGLKITEFSDGASYKDEKSNTIFFGGINGFVSIQKDRGPDMAYMPKIYFDKLTIFGENQNISEFIGQNNHEDRLELTYKQNFFSVSFTAIDYLNGGNYTYYYKIDGLSDQWINNGGSNEASFSNIAPGNYTLLVKYYSRTLEKESPVYSLKIRIYPPWYLSGWAYLAYLLVVLYAVFLVYRYYIRNQTRRKQELLNEIEKKHQKDVYESKLRFFTNIAHEFCTPLTLISGPCERILAQQGTSKFVTNYVYMIQTNAERLNNLIQELIEFRRIETGNRDISIEKLKVTLETKKILDMFSNLKDSKAINVTFLSAKDIEWNSDKGFFITIITNLISNAFKYTSNNNEIKISLTESNNQLIITIANEGSSILEIDSKRVFDRYTILDNFEKGENNQRFSRNGLGLAISYNMVKLLNGTIEVTTVDNYVTFTVKLPYLEQTVNSDSNLAKITYSPEIIQQKIFNLPTYNFDKLRSTILIIDDDIEILWLIGELFSSEFNIIPLSDSLQIDNVLNEVYPNIIISDIMQPGLDGIELTRKIKSNKETAHIPIILISGINEVDKQIEALEAGAEMYISKPFNTKYLKISVHQIIERKEKLRNYFSSPISSYEMFEGKYTHAEQKKFMHSVMKVINENITNSDLSTQFIADKLGIGTRSLYRKMQDIGDESFSNLIKECRLIFAADLLLKSKMTIDEIVYKSGFSNKVTFFKAFQKKYSCTPKNYRTKNDTYA